MKLKTAKGVKDFSPEEQIVRDLVVSKIIKIFGKYGFSPLDTPILERFETLSSKYAGGEEILKETFKLKDQGKRNLGLRYDLTVPLARYISQNPNTKMPFKRYQLGKVFRDGPVSSARLREFIQLDVDTIGSPSLTTDSEIIALTSDVFIELNIDYTIKVNSRIILDGILKKVKIKEEKRSAIILTIDKLDKIGEENVKQELKSKLIDDKKIDKIFELIKSNDLSKENIEGVKELNKIIKYAKKLGAKNIQIDYSLARGLTYYTGMVVEVFSKRKESIAAGGRYDNMIGSFSGKNIPAVGISFGIDRICLDFEKDKKTLAEVYVIPIKTLEKSLEIVRELRKNDINVDLDLNERGISKNLDYANKLNIPYVIFIGEKELKENKLKLKDMKSGKEKLLNLNEVIKELKA